MLARWTVAFSLATMAHLREDCDLEEDLQARSGRATAARQALISAAQNVVKEQRKTCMVGSPDILETLHSLKRKGMSLLGASQDVLPEDERAALLAARHRPNAALQVLSQVVAGACLRETQVRQPFGQRPNIGLG